MEWGRAGKTSQFRFKIEDSDEERKINTDWFSREIIHNAITVQKWNQLKEPVREAINLRHLEIRPRRWQPRWKIEDGSDGLGGFNRSAS